MTTDDYKLLDQLYNIGERLSCFTGGILTNTLSVAEQLDFCYRLIASAGRIRARVERAGADHKQAANGAGL